MSESLPAAVLSKAFAGDLVPTEAELALAEDRDYESAEALLARVVRTADSADKSAGQNRRRGKRSSRVVDPTLGPRTTRGSAPARA